MNGIEQKSSLNYVNPEVIKVGKCHPTWSTVPRTHVIGEPNSVIYITAQLKCRQHFNEGLDGGSGIHYSLKI